MKSLSTIGRLCLDSIPAIVGLFILALLFIMIEGCSRSADAMTVPDAQGQSANVDCVRVGTPQYFQANECPQDSVLVGVTQDAIGCAKLSMKCTMRAAIALTK